MGVDTPQPSLIFEGSVRVTSSIVPPLLLSVTGSQHLQIGRLAWPMTRHFDHSTGISTPMLQAVHIKTKKLNVESGPADPYANEEFR